MWEHAADYKSIVEQYWGIFISGTILFKIMQRMKNIKKGLNDMNQRGFSTMQAETKDAYQKLQRVQKDLHRNPSNSCLINTEVEAIKIHKHLKGSINIIYATRGINADWVDTVE
ncbi:Cytochrome P450 monooxygenase sol6, partial [Bienertia sinuspersici]